MKICIKVQVKTQNKCKSSFGFEKSVLFVLLILIGDIRRYVR